MKSLWSVLLITFCMQAQSNEQLFSFAQKEYENHNFEKALSLFAQIKPANATVWYNMGACYFHLDKELDALLHWQRAYQYGTGSLVHASAARIAELEATLQIAQPHGARSLLHQCVQANLQSLSLLLLQILFFCAFSVFLFVAGRWNIRKNYFASGASLLLVLVLASAVSIKYTQQATQTAVVFENNAALLVGPNREYHTVGTVNAGMRVAIIKQQDNWCKINCEHAVGWIEKKCIAFL